MSKDEKQKTEDRSQKPEEKENKTQIDTAPQGDQSVKGAPQGTPAAAEAPQVDKPVDDKVDKPVDDKVDKPVDDKVDKPVKPPVEQPTGKKRIRYAFPTVSRCPRCRTTDTTATSTQGKVQYRRCLRAICKWTYQVIGKKV